jgi:thioredoxin 1
MWLGIFSENIFKRSTVRSIIISWEALNKNQGKQVEEAVKSKTILVFSFMIVLAMVGLCRADVVDDTLNNARKQGKVVMLEIGSVGCIPCDKMKLVMDRLRTDYKGKLEVVFIDVRSDKENQRRFGATVIPTQVFLDKEGKEFHRHIGYYSFEEIAPVLKKQGI